MYTAKVIAKEYLRISDPTLEAKLDLFVAIAESQVWFEVGLNENNFAKLNEKQQQLVYSVVAEIAVIKYNQSLMLGTSQSNDGVSSISFTSDYPEHVRLTLNKLAILVATLPDDV